MYDQLQTFTAGYISLTSLKWAEILPYFQPLNILKGDFIVREGETTSYIYFINAGLFRIFYLKDGIETNRYFASENEFATTLTSFLTQQPTFENMQALENSFVLKLHYDSLQLIYKVHPAWESFFRQLLQEAYIGMAKRIESFITKSAEERYSDFIKLNPHLLQRVPQQYIATYLGITPVSLSRIRGQISKTH